MLLFNLYLFKMCLLLGKVTCVSAPTMIMWMTTWWNTYDFPFKRSKWL